MGRHHPDAVAVWLRTLATEGEEMSKRALCILYGVCAVLITVVAVMGILGCADEPAPVTVVEETTDTVWVLSLGDGGSGICGVCTQDTTVVFEVRSLGECDSAARDFFDTTRCAYASFNRR